MTFLRSSCTIFNGEYTANEILLNDTMHTILKFKLYSSYHIICCMISSSSLAYLRSMHGFIATIGHVFHNVCVKLNGEIFLIVHNNYMLCIYTCVYNYYVQMCFFLKSILPSAQAVHSSPYVQELDTMTLKIIADEVSHPMTEWASNVHSTM